ncbi:MAG: DUF2180 family protein [Kaiparowitsia implicata GSE-PSE-MK54-09C]|jgi:hypothetical protein|nr:DUF2180 family protein [Kaiparowitsia implicata GSE-PSE-MK54-09C]
MKCYYHNDVDAVAICKNCNRGICPKCAAEIENGIACRNRCESEVQALDELMQRGKSAYQKTAGVYMQYAVWLTLSGILFLGFGLLQWQTALALFLVPMGVITLIGALFTYSGSKKFSRRER